MKRKEKREPELIIKEIKRKARRKFNSEEKIRIVLEGLQGESSIAELDDIPVLFFKFMSLNNFI
jgi:transposase